MLAFFPAPPAEGELSVLEGEEAAAEAEHRAQSPVLARRAAAAVQASKGVQAMVVVQAAVAQAATVVQAAVVQAGVVQASAQLSTL